MPSTLAQDRALLEKAGIFLPAEMKHYSDDAALPLQAGLQTTLNGGIPAFLANIIDPKIIRVLLTPNNAVKITGERGLGNWTTVSTQFPVAEPSGVVSTYGDWDNNGSAGANFNWVPREQYVYQGIAQWGDRELEMYGLAKIDYANEVRFGRVTSFDKFQNASYFFGVANLKNYGLLNDPALLPSIAPAGAWSAAQPEAITNDVTALFTQLIRQTGELVTSDDRLILALSGISMSRINRTNQYGLSAKKALMDIYPKLEFVTAPEYSTASGELVQLIAPSIQGQETLISAFGDKLRAFPVFRDLSAFKQKFAAGTWGCIIKFPPGIAQMLGV